MLIIMQRKNRLPKYEMVLQSVLHIKIMNCYFFLNKKKIVTQGKDWPLYVDVYLNPQQSVTCHDRMIKVWYTPNISSFYIYILVKTWSGWISDDLAIIKADFTVFN